MPDVRVIKKGIARNFFFSGFSRLLKSPPCLRHSRCTCEMGPHFLSTADFSRLIRVTGRPASSELWKFFVQHAGSGQASTNFGHLTIDETRFLRCVQSVRQAIFGFGAERTCPLYIWIWRGVMYREHVPLVHSLYPLTFKIENMLLTFLQHP